MGNKPSYSILLWMVLPLLGVVAGFWFMLSAQGKQVAELAGENERLRLFNAREVRRYKRPNANPRQDALNNASHILGTPAKVIEAVWRQENGPPDIETGVLGKTAYFSKNSPVTDWAALETARTLNIYTWKWLTKTPEGKKALIHVLKFASGPYIDEAKMGKAQAKVWADTVYKFSQEEPNGHTR